jgi:flagellar hook-basal body complex protein FliE
MMSVPVTNINRLVPGLIEKIGSNPAADKASSEVNKGQFADLLTNVINSTNELQAASAEAQRALMAGESVELHEVMIKGEEAGLAMDLLLEIRNRIVNGYNEIMRMPM